MDDGFADDPSEDFSNADWPDTVFLLNGDEATGEECIKAGRVDVCRTKSSCGSGDRFAEGMRAGSEREELFFSVFGVPTRGPVRPFRLFGGSLDSFGGNDFEDHWLGGLRWSACPDQGTFNDWGRFEL